MPARGGGLQGSAGAPKICASPKTLNQLFDLSLKGWSRRLRAKNMKDINVATKHWAIEPRPNSPIKPDRINFRPSSTTSWGRS